MKKETETKRKIIKVLIPIFILSLILLCALYFLLIEKKEKPPIYDFILNFPDAEKSKAIAEHKNDIILEDPAYLLNHNLLLKKILMLFSTDAVMVNKAGKQLINDPLTMKNGGFLLTYFYNPSHKTKYTFDLKNSGNGSSYEVDLLLGESVSLEVYKNDPIGRNLLDGFKYSPSIKRKNALFIISYEKYLVIFDDSSILFQMKDNAAHTQTAGRFTFSTDSRQDKFNLKAAEIPDTLNGFLKMQYLEEQIKDAPPHKFNYTEKNWNKLYLEEYAGLSQGKHPWIHRLMLKDTTMPALFLKCGDEIKYNLELPEKPVLEFNLGLNPKYIVDKNRLIFEAKITPSNDNKPPQILRLKLADLEEISSRFYRFRITPKNGITGKVSVSFKFTTVDEKFIKNEKEIILALASPAAFSTIKNKNAKNVILISLDTLGARHLGCYGYKRDTTPMIDAFAEKFRLFQNAFSNSSWTLPSHISMMSSKYPYETGYFQTKMPFNRIRIAQNVEMLAQYLKADGFWTFAITGGANVSAKFGFDRGFDAYIEKKDWKEKDIADEIDRAIDILKDAGARNFFLFFHTYQIHAPYSVDTVCDWQDKKGNYRENIIAKYDSQVLYTDKHIGRFLGWLEKNNILENTLVIITSDHGENFDYIEPGALSGEHGITMYDEEIKVPLIIGGDAAFSGGKNISGVVSNIDIVPTILDFLDIGIPDGLRGTSLLGYDKKSAGKDKVIYAEGVYRKPYEIKAVRSCEKKFIENLVKKDQANIPQYEFYNTSEDKYEKKNLYSPDNKEVGVFRSLLFKIVQSIDAGRKKIIRTPGLSALDDKELENQLKQLGYIN